MLNTVDEQRLQLQQLKEEFAQYKQGPWEECPTLIAICSLAAKVLLEQMEPHLPVRYPENQESFRLNLYHGLRNFRELVQQSEPQGPLGNELIKVMFAFGGSYVTRYEGIIDRRSQKRIRDAGRIILCDKIRNALNAREVEGGGWQATVTYKKGRHHDIAAVIAKTVLGVVPGVYEAVKGAAPCDSCDSRSDESDDGR